MSDAHFIVGCVLPLVIPLLYWLLWTLGSRSNRTKDEDKRSPPQPTHSPRAQRPPGFAVFALACVAKSASSFFESSHPTLGLVLLAVFFVLFLVFFYGAWRLNRMQKQLPGK